ncbi:MAG: thiolase domain-containing protein [Thermoanaerobaculales bacterium]|nr:thiolase domain-containing protein [Thermoanaerobaculales bacterium]
MRDVAVVGVGMTEFGELWSESLRTIWTKAATAALADAGLDSVDLITVGCMSPGLFVGQEHLASLLADELGMAGVAATRVESACASGGLAVRAGFAEIAAGLADTVLVTGVEKMTDVDGADATYALGSAADQEWEGFHGITFPGLYAMLARAHMARYGTTREQMAAVAVKNHANGLLNPHAQYHLKVTAKDVLESTLVADPLRLLDCSPVTDGAAAVVLTTVERARELAAGRPVVTITGSGLATDTITLANREELSELRAVRLAAERAYRMAGRRPEQLHVVEVHDCFTIAEIMATEAIGLFDPGFGGSAAADGLTALGGKIPVNTSGGLKSKGHPVGATGVAQVVELVNQLRGEAGQRQVEGAAIGLAQNMGGSGGSSVVHILEVVR